ncbi:diguanylate cyclase [Arcobacter sp. 15-2]|uniref:diguanylate cyclase n=1 Tax=Arcobacter sp. 15-2 TaxID=3374109 RepID=UPI00399C8915
MNILIVDDSKTIIQSLKHSIEEKLNLTVYTAASMKECADLVLEHKGKFTLALLDYNLPDAQNGEIITFIKKFNIPSILLTGSILEKSNPVFKNNNLIDYILKDGSQAIDYSLSVIKRFILNEDIEILVIDDSKTFAAKMQGLCIKYNLKAIVNYSAKEALDTIKQRPNIKLILVDYMMPEMNGLEFTKKLRKSYKKDEVAVIALSGTSEKEIVASFLKYGANDFLYKDFSDEEFFGRVNNNLEVIELFQDTQDKAKKDYLTGLFNRNYLFDAGEEIYQRAKSRKELLAVILLDINKFKIINDSYGHDVGDAAIKAVGDFLIKYINKDSLIARMGADEFCILFKNRPYAEIYQTFQEIQEVIEKSTFQLVDMTLQLTVSVGATIAFEDNLEEMIASSADALFQAKEKKKIIINT